MLFITSSYKRVLHVVRYRYMGFTCLYIKVIYKSRVFLPVLHVARYRYMHILPTLH